MEGSQVWSGLSYHFMLQSASIMTFVKRPPSLWLAKFIEHWCQALYRLSTHQILTMALWKLINFPILEMRKQKLRLSRNDYTTCKSWTLMVWLHPLSLLPCLKVFLWGCSFRFQIVFTVRNVFLMLKSISPLVPTIYTSSVSGTVQTMANPSFTWWLSSMWR